MIQNYINIYMCINQTILNFQQTLISPQKKTLNQKITYYIITAKIQA